MASRLTLRVQDQLARLSPGEAKLGRLILDTPDLVAEHSATELARLAGVSKATAARFFRSLGYEDFQAVKRQVREERNRAAPWQRCGRDASVASAAGGIGGHLERELANLSRTFEEMRVEHLQKAAELIQNAPALWFLGIDAEEPLARYARLLFSRQRHAVRQLGTGGTWAEELAMTGAADTLVLFSLTPRPRIQRRIVDYAVTTRMDIVTITDTLGAQRAQRFSRFVLPCHVSSAGRAPSRTALYSVIHLLLTACAALSDGAAQQRLAAIDAIHEELDDLE